MVNHIFNKYNIIFLKISNIGWLIHEQRIINVKRKMFAKNLANAGEKTLSIPSTWCCAHILTETWIQALKIFTECGVTAECMSVCKRACLCVCVSCEFRIHDVGRRSMAAWSNVCVWVCVYVRVNTELLLEYCWYATP